MFAWSEEDKAVIANSPRLQAYYNGSHCLDGGDENWLYREMTDDEWDFVLAHSANTISACGLAVTRIKYQGQKPGEWSKEISDATRARMDGRSARNRAKLEAAARGERQA